MEIAFFSFSIDLKVDPFLNDPSVQSTNQSESYCVLSCDFVVIPAVSSNIIIRMLGYILSLGNKLLSAMK